MHDYSEENRDENHHLHWVELSSERLAKIVEELQRLIAENNAEDQVELAGQFCMGTCQQGVCVTLDEELFSLTPETTRAFFEKEVAPRL